MKKYDQKDLTYRGWDVEFDTVIGRIGGKCLLTLVLLPSLLFIARLLDRKTQECVCEQFNWLEQVMRDNRERCHGEGGVWWFFSSALTDRGSEMSDFKGLERSLFPIESPYGDDVTRRTSVFYCDPYTSSQKPHIEETHTLLRRVLPKRTSFDDLEQDQINLICSHINSYSRASLEGMRPFDLVPAGFSDKLSVALGLELIEPDQVCLTPRLIGR